jgi:hypothetical protein
VYLFAADVRRRRRIGRIGGGRVIRGGGVRGGGRRSGCQSGVGRQFGNDPRQGPILRLQLLIFGLQFLQLLKKKKKKKIPQKETTKEREMCGDSNRFPFLHREGGGHVVEEM